MFKFLERIAKLEKQYLALRQTVECETCGCLLDKNTAIKGKSTVEKKTESPLMQLGASVREFLRTLNQKAYIPVDNNEYIKEHYFCKVHGKKK